MLLPRSLQLGLDWQQSLLEHVSQATAGTKIDAQRKKERDQKQ